MAASQTRKSGLQLFSPAEAPKLHETPMMSMPVTDPPALEQLVEWAGSGGHVVKVLFGDPEAGGMSLVWSWFGPNFILPRHSHSADCLYYVTRGQLTMGNRTVEAGAGFFVPENAPYAYTAGPEGVEILEFRGQSTFDMRISESLPRWEQILATARANQDQWAGEAAVHQ